MHLVEIVVGATGERLLLGRFVDAHAHAGFSGVADFAAEDGDGFALERGSELGVGDEIFFGEAALF